MQEIITNPLEDQIIYKCKYLAECNVKIENFSNIPTKLKKDFTPFHFYIGYIIKLKNEIYEILDFEFRDNYNFEFDMYFITNLGEVKVEILDLEKIEITSEINDIFKLLRANISKLRFCD